MFLDQSHSLQITPPLVFWCFRKQNLQKYEKLIYQVRVPPYFSFEKSYFSITQTKGHTLLLFEKSKFSKLKPRVLPYFLFEKKCFFKTLTKGPPLVLFSKKLVFSKLKPRVPPYFFQKTSDFATDNPPWFSGFWSEGGVICRECDWWAEKMLSPLMLGWNKCI